MEFGRTLVVAAHPDDEVLGAGGVIAALSGSGGDVTVLIATDGSSAQYPDDDEIDTQKRSEARKANEILGTSTLVQWELPDMRLDTVPHHELNGRLTDFIREGEFESVFVHSPHDINRDHQILYESVLVATRPVPDQLVFRVLTYFVNSSTEWGALASQVAFLPNCYIDITKTIEKKVDAMRAYSCELRDHPHPRSLKAIRDRAAVFGSESGYEYAEAFRIVLLRTSC